MAARAIFRGVLRFEPVEVPVKLYSAVEDRQVRFHLLHDQDLERVRQRMVNPITGREVKREEVRWGAPTGEGEFVILSDEEREAVRAETDRTIRVERFLDPAVIDDRFYERPYWLGPDEGAGESYHALAAALEAEGKEGVARWAMRRKEYVGALRAQNGHLLLVTLRHPEEIVPVRALDPPAGREFEAREIAMAEQLVATLVDRFDPTAVRDEYRERVLALVKAKAEGRSFDFETVEGETGRRPLADLLEASLAESKKREKARA